MHRPTDQLRARIILEVFGLANVALAPQEFTRNFNADEARVRVALKELCCDGYIERVGGDAYRLTCKGEYEVVRLAGQNVAD